MSATTLSDLRQQALALVMERGYERREEPFTLASGQLSHDYVDVKAAIDTGARLRLVSEAIAELAREQGMDFTAVGGLTMGADPLAHGVCIVADTKWFSVRKEPKKRGHEAWIEGARLSDEDRVLLVDDVVTTGGSTLKAYERVIETGAKVVGVIPMVDRGEGGRELFRGLHAAYAPLLTYTDLGIEPVAAG